MASGSFGVSTSNKYVAGTVNWRSTPNTGGNYSDVYVEMRFSRTNTGYTTYGTGTFGLYVDGQQAVNTTGFSFTYNSNTLVVSGNFRVNHNSDGSKNLRIGASGYTDVFSINDAVVYVDLDRIPRASTVSSNISWTAAIEPLPISINRASTAFDHIVTVEVQKPDNSMAAIAWRGNVGDNVTFYFTKEETTILYQAIGGYENRPVKIKVQTWYNGSVIGETEKWGTVYGATPATPVLSDFDIGTKNVPVTLDYYYSEFAYSLVFTFGSFTKTFSTGVGKTFTMTFDDADIAKMYQQTPNDNVKQANVWASTKYNGVEINDGLPKDQNKKVNLRVVNSNPTYTGGFTYLDTNATTTTLTGNNQYLVQNKSTLQVKIPATAKAVAQNSATMVRYEVAVNGATQSINYATTDLTLNFGTVDAASNATITVTAIDSRGNRTSASSVILMLAYSPPTLATSADRLNNFETSTTLKLSGSASPLTIGGVNKNAITSAKYQYRQVGGTYNTAANFTVTGFPNFTATNVTVNLDNTIAWDVLITVTDKVGSTVTATRTVAVGTPIFFIDTVKKTLGVNKFPTSAANGLEIAGDLDVDGILKLKANQWIAQGKWSLHANGGDFMAVNCIYFSSPVSSTGQGLNFLRPGKTAGSTNAADYSTFGVLDYAMRMNNQNIFYQFPNTGNLRFGGDFYSQNSGGVYFDVFGNIKGQPDAGSGNTWSLKDSDNRARLLFGIGKGSTQPNEYRSHVNGHDFYHDDRKFLSFFTHENYSGRCIQFGSDGGILKWYVNYNNFQGRLEARNSSNTNWCELAGNLNNASSREYKDNIEVFKGSAMEIINSSVAKTYTYKGDASQQVKIGLIAEEAPELISGADTVDSYGMATLSWKGLQEVYAELQELKQKVNSKLA
ncbi:putative minor structural protein 1 [Bacillus phage BCP78]|uniref:Putative minor structural protein n=2 Tax=Tsarbombavirus BCP78 TaxID=1985182 RepID=J9PS01_9CAUD|nr:tail protein [Bacillus phage BCP78]YP_009783562.1 putative minor structural protein [Bacillus phage BCU4]AEW47207.1 putative minor structural protein 1 [Bacillus phage BCP78]AEW47695.1 putative minor structural protein [Bacillus phage BCU4]